MRENPRTDFLFDVHRICAVALFYILPQLRGHQSAGFNGPQLEKRLYFQWQAVRVGGVYITPWVSTELPTRYTPTRSPCVYFSLRLFIATPNHLLQLSSIFFLLIRSMFCTLITLITLLLHLWHMRLDFFTYIKLFMVVTYICQNSSRSNLLVSSPSYFLSI